MYVKFVLLQNAQTHFGASAIWLEQNAGETRWNCKTRPLLCGRTS